MPAKGLRVGEGHVALGIQPMYTFCGEHFGAGKQMGSQNQTKCVPPKKSGFKGSPSSEYSHRTQLANHSQGTERIVLTFLHARKA